MKRYPLATLVRLREHRTEAARQLVLQRQREAALQRDACRRIEEEIQALDLERAHQRRQLLDPPPPGLAWPSALAQREAHIGLLQAQATAARERLVAAREALSQAEAALQQARDGYHQARAREDALKKRKDLWRDQQYAQELRQEENATAELLQARHATTAFH